ncbi:UDP-2,3-diacylglucosamine diphosphatase [Candidatus Thiothrix anitrata]|uniref:UDP-2,3-diacylglucosamine hydrolase n=1 Tax=Candidatus Thiothrix anitrata TaxID=2823902 RepID=A0ABX7X3Y6_9GAMM|nr:UDP-2,3-diacylglucosamine diphosphatase [Candidatus Thiothrix anitrata]QTR49323.1 UDP-2,3-diacylglucosamine diphosphatase [Candidatus Thiothrix anitrata]
MATWFISDLHLDANTPAIVQSFLSLLEQLADDAEALYILGDFFEYWVGDDALDISSTAVFQPVIRALQRLSKQGVALYFLHGNRDFLVGDGFAQAAGCTLLPEHQLIDLYGTPTLLLHGDTLCTDDVDYQKIRKMFRNPQWQAQFLALPLAERIRQAEAMREQSRLAMQHKQAEILDVNPQSVVETLQAYGVTRMIHGHTHRPAIHDVVVPNSNSKAQRIVLGDWDDNKISYLRVDSNEMVLES